MNIFFCLTSEQQKAFYFIHFLLGRPVHTAVLTLWHCFLFCLKTGHGATVKKSKSKTRARTTMTSQLPCSFTKKVSKAKF